VSPFFVDLISTDAAIQHKKKGPVLGAGSERGWVGGAAPGDELRYAPGRLLCFREEEAKAAQQADTAMTIKVQVTLDAGLFPL
jgi:hypothetical protein